MTRLRTVLALCLAAGNSHRGLYAQTGFVPVVNPPLSVVSPGGDWQARYQSGLDLFKSGQHSAASEQIAAALREAEARHVPGPELAMVVHLLGQLEYRSGRYRSSLQHFERAIKLLPAYDREDDRAIALADAAQSCISLAEVGRAQRLIRQALELRPERSEYWQLFGVALFLAGRDTEAEAAATRAIGLAGTRKGEVYGAAKTLLAAIYLRRKQYAEAMQAFDSALLAIESGPIRARTLANRGGLWWKLGKKEAAEADLRDALAVAAAAFGPAHPELVYILDDYSVVLRGMGRKREARNAAERAAQIRASSDAEANLSAQVVNWQDLR